VNEYRDQSSKGSLVSLGAVEVRFELRLEAFHSGADQRMGLEGISHAKLDWLIGRAVRVLDKLEEERCNDEVSRRDFVADDAFVVALFHLGFNAIEPLANGSGVIFCYLRLALRRSE